MPTKKATTGEEGGIAEAVRLVRLEQRVVDIPIIGSAPLIQHKWSEKALRSMPGSPYATTESRMRKKGVREPEVEAESCLYRMSGNRVGFPATGFKAAITGAYDLFGRAITKTLLKRIVFVEGEVVGSNLLVPIVYDDELQLREDAPRIKGGSTDLRYRYQLYPWRAMLRIRYIPTSITEESLVALVDAGGLGGVGDWRPSSPISSTGTYGTFRVADENEAEQYEFTY